MEPLVKLVIEDKLGEALSARPDAPVVTDAVPDGRLHRTGPARELTARALRRLADRIEPARPAVSNCC